MSNQRIYLSAPHLDGDEAALVGEVFASNWIAPVGPHITRFENDFAERIGVPAACAVASGTAALHLSLLLAGVRPGDRVAVATLTFVATANPVVYCGAEPVFVDSEPVTWGMDPARLAEAFAACRAQGRPIRAVIPVHLYGQPCRIEEIAALCAAEGAALIEDAAESLGATVGGRATGSFGDFAAHSFNGNKIITTSGGGMLTARDPAAVERARFLSTQAKDPGGYYRHSELGFNYRMSNVCAAIGIGQLRRLDAKVARRRAILARYRTALGGLAGVSFPAEIDGMFSTGWLTTLILGSGARIAPEELVRRMEVHNIECRPVWSPLHRQRLYAGSLCFGGAVAEGLAAAAVNLPSGSGMSDAEQGRVIELLRGELAG